MGISTINKIQDSGVSVHICDIHSHLQLFLAIFLKSTVLLGFSDEMCLKKNVNVIPKVLDSRYLVSWDIEYCMGL